MRRLASKLAGRRPFPVEAATATTEHERPGLSDVETEIAGLLDRSTRELRMAWCKMHRTEPPLGLSRDLLIRALAYDLQEPGHGGPSTALRRRLRRLVGDFEKGALSANADIAPKTGTTLLRAWRGQTHTVLVSENGF